MLVSIDEDDSIFTIRYDLGVQDFVDTYQQSA